MKISKVAGKGFTLIELLVVVAIISVLVTMVSVSMSGSRGKARDARRLSDIKQIVSAQEAAMSDGQAYQVSPQIVGTMPAIKNAAGYQYLTTVADPMNGGGYQYVWVANNAACGARPAGSYYCVIAKLEDSSSCGGGHYKYLAANNFALKEICVANDAAHDYVANPPACSVCLAL